MANVFTRIIVGLILGTIIGGFIEFSLNHHTPYAYLAGALAGTAVFFAIALRTSKPTEIPKSAEQMRLDAFKQRRS